MFKKELEELMQKHKKNIQSAYADIMNFDGDSYKHELEIILKYFGKEYSPESSDLEEQLREIKNKFNISCRTITLNDNWYENSMLPLMAEKGGELKAILPDMYGGCRFYDGRRRIRIKERNAADFGKTALCFYRGFDDEKISRLSLIKYMLKCITASEYITLFVSMIIVTLFSTVMPRAQYYIFNHVVPAGTKGDILPVSCLLSGIILISLVVYIFKGFAAANIPLCINANLQGAVISRLLNLKAGFFNGQRSGDLSAAITKISDIGALFSAESMSAFLSFVLSGIYATRIYISAKEFTPFLYVAFAAALILTTLNAFFISRYRSRFSKSLGDMTGFVYELFSGMENVKQSNADSAMFSRWGGFYSKSLRAQKRPFITKYYTAIYTFMVSAITLAVFKVGISSGASAAEFIIFMSLYGLFIGSVSGIGAAFDAAAKFNSAYTRLEDFFRAETEETENKRSLRGFEGNIEFLDVSFKYPGSNVYALENISFSIKKGQKIGITGKSGCGKSTLIKLLLGFEQPQNGRIFIDNTDLNEISLSSYRRKLGIVLQSSKLIPADIFSNITLTAPQATAEDVNRAVDAVGLREDIEKMPMGLHTFVSDDNLTISGGQKQRILLARALIGSPSLLVLDEATNALDNVTQAAVTRYIENLNTTALIVAHRLSTIRSCDYILVLNKGEIAEQGSFDELIRRKGEFYELVKNQMQ